MVGQRLLHFDVLERIGHGGMGVVYVARDTRLDRLVAIKVLASDVLTDEQRARFRQEARLASALNHPNIITVHDVDRVGDLDFIVMEYLRGQPLTDLISSEGLPLDQAVGFAAQAADALAAAHAHGVVHRDIKPANIMVIDGQFVKILDFGLAKHTREGERTMAWTGTTQVGSVMGTVAYMSPEQAAGELVEARSDVFSLGATLYEMVCGTRPFGGANVLAVLHDIQVGRIEPVTSRNPHVPAALADLIHCALEKNSARRPDAGALAAALRALLPTLANRSESMPAFHVTTATPGITPPRRAKGPAAHNLPAPLTTFVGRATELEKLPRILAEFRIVTLVGPGGVGKTRVALRVAADTLDRHPDGVWLIELASVTTPEHVGAAVATALGVKEGWKQSPAGAVTEYLRERSVLLILDNCEHVRDACAELSASLLARCPAVRILATSRSLLSVPGEANVRLAPLDLPELDQPIDVERLARFEAIQLFVERATAVQPAFRLTPANAESIRHVCQRLDGMPLALELAAARVRFMPVEEIARRIDDRFRLLTGGARVLLPRQQTLRALIDWGHDLLSDAERVLFRRLSIFPAGFGLDAAEAMWADRDHEIAALDLLAELVDKSLVVAEDSNGHARYRMLETIRAYAAEKCDQARERPLVERWLAAWSVDLVVERLPQLGRDEQWTRIVLEHETIRAAIDNLAASRQASADELRLCLALQPLWRHRGRYAEARARLEGAVSRAPADDPLRISGLLEIAHMAHLQGDVAAAEASAQAALAQARAACDEALTARALLRFGALREGTDVDAARAFLSEAVAVFRRIGDLAGTARALNALGTIHAVISTDAARGIELFEESVEVSLAAADKMFAVFPLGNLAIQWLLVDEARALAVMSRKEQLQRELKLPIDETSHAFRALHLLVRGDYAGLIAYATDARQAIRELGASNGVPARMLDYWVAQAHYFVGAIEVARSLLRMAGSADDRWAHLFVPMHCRMLALIAWRAGRREAAARLFGVGSRGVRMEATAAVQAFDQATRDLRRALGEHAYDALFTEGREMALDRVAGVADAASVG